MKSALQDALKTFDKLVNFKLDKAPLPVRQDRVYPVSTLPNGQLLLSDGTSKVSVPTQRINHIKNNAFVMAANPGVLQQLVETLPLHIAIPQNQVGNGENQTTAFMNYITNFLKPQMNAATTAQIAFMPGQDATKVVPQLNTNIPSTQPTENFWNRLKNPQQNLGEELKKDFVTFSQTQEQANPQTYNTNLPLISSYSNAYGLPMAQDAAYTNFSNGSNNLTDSI